MTVPERGSEQPELDDEMEEGEDKESQRGRCQHQPYAPCEICQQSVTASFR